MVHLSKALICALAVDVSAIRQTLHDSKKGTSTSALDAVSALVQSGDAAKSTADLNKVLSALQATPEAMESLRASLTAVVGDLKTNVLSKIENGFQLTQVEVSSRMSDLTAATSAAVGAKAEADASDSNWIACIGTEKSKLEAHEAAVSALAAAEAAKVQPCAEQDAAAPYSFTPELNFEFKCDFFSGDCDSAQTNYNTMVNDMLSSLSNDLDAKSAVYTAAKGRCDDAKAFIVVKEGELEAAGDAYDTQRRVCSEQHADRNTELCVFGEKLQEKCSSLSLFTSLLDSVDQTNGGQYSEPDRAAEWDTTKTTICLLDKIVADQTIDDAALQACKDSINYKDQVGDLDRKDAELGEQTGGDNFNCEETTISFNGETWETPSADVSKPPSTDYKKVAFAPPVTLADGRPFEFCPGQQPGKR